MLDSRERSKREVCTRGDEAQAEKSKQERRADRGRRECDMSKMSGDNQETKVCEPNAGRVKGLKHYNSQRTTQSFPLPGRLHIG